jgi:hypothetical protein
LRNEDSNKLVHIHSTHNYLKYEKLSSAMSGFHNKFVDDVEGGGGIVDDIITD